MRKLKDLIKPKKYGWEDSYFASRLNDQMRALREMDIHFKKCPVCSGRTQGICSEYNFN